MQRGEKRGICIPLAYRSWELVIEVLTYVVEKPHLDDLEEGREEIGKVLRHIKNKLEEDDQREVEIRRRGNLT